MGSTFMHASQLTKWIIGHWFGMSSSCLAGLSQGNITGSPGTEEPITSTIRSTPAMNECGAARLHLVAVRSSSIDPLS